MKVTPFHCGPFANVSERKALEHLKQRLVSIPGDGEWVLLSNLSFSANHRKQAAEIDIVAIGPPGVRVIEVKHWPTRWINRNQASVEHEADKITDKARKIGTTLRERVLSGLGRVDGVFFVTQARSKVKGLANRSVKGVPLYTLDQWREALDADAPKVLSRPQVQKLAEALEPKASVALDGSLQRLADYVDLSLQTPVAQRFHRTYKATHASRRERVILHLYDLSAVDIDAENKARREFEALRRVQRHRWAPRIRDSHQDVPGYAGEMAFFTIDDPAAPSLSLRKADVSWGTEERLDFALQALRALDELHTETTGGEPLVHRNVSPETVLVRHDNRPILTGFDRAKIPEHSTVAVGRATQDSDTTFVAPEVLEQGLSAADHRSDIYQLCATLAELFSDRADETSRSSLDVLGSGTAALARDRAHLHALVRGLRKLRGEHVSRPSAPPAEFWTADQIVSFGSSDYKIVEKLGQGGIGIAYKVAKLDSRSAETLGHYVAKVVLEAPTGRVVLDSYRRVHAHLRHSALSTIFEVAPEWQENCILALLTWIEGEPLKDNLGSLGLVAAERIDSAPESTVLNWLRELCRALDVLHRNDLVHGDVSPGNLILTASEIVLTDYDLVTRIGHVASSPGTHLYCSPSRAANQPAEPSDDFYALAASFFHAIFGIKPFQYGGNRSKDRGLNWDGIDTAPFPVIRRFLDRATDPRTAGRYSSAEEALKDLNAQHGESPRVTTEPHKSYAIIRVVLRAHWLPRSWRAQFGWVLGRLSSVVLPRQLMYDLDPPKQILDEDVLSALKGDPSAQYGLGERYYSGNKVRQNYTEASEWFRKAAEQGYANAQYRLGELYHLGEGVPEDVDEAVEWYLRAAEQGHMWAQYDLGELYSCGTDDPQEFVEAANWYRKSAEQGHMGAQYELGKLYDEGLGVERDFAEAERWCIKSADNGHAEAQYWLGDFYDRGRKGVAQDQSKALQWYRKAAEKGHPEAQFSLGMIHDELVSEGAYGVEKDSAEAAVWYQKAAENGQYSAPFYLGLLRSGPRDGIEEDCTEAAKWWLMGAELGDEACQYWLGKLYHEGCEKCGIMRKPSDAVKWYRKAVEQGDMVNYGVQQYRESAEHGDAEAQYQMGGLYRLGKGVARDYAEAEGWYRRAAEQGHAEAQYWIGRLYEGGLGVEQDDSEAAEWYGKAAGRILGMG